MRFLPLLLAGVLACTALPGQAGTKKHHHTNSVQAQVQALHRIHLAAKQKKEWRQHLVKLKELPHAERVAEKRHERKWQHKHDAKVDALQAAREAKIAHLQAAARQANREARMAARREAKTQPHRHRHAAVVAAAPPKPRHAPALHRAAVQSASAHEKNASAHLYLQRQNQYAHAKNLAALSSARQENAAAHQKLAQARQAQRLAGRAMHLANVNAAAQAHRANLLTAHNARVTAERSHWIALHGDGSGGSSIHFWQTAAAGVPVKVISVNLNDPNVKVSAVMARHGNGTAEPFRQMIDRAQPNVAVTGTFFSLDDLQPVGDIVIDGSLVHFGGMGTALCITPGNHADMVTCEWGRHHDWSPYDFVVACGPRLLNRGRVVLDPRSERFHDKHMLAPNSRIAVGITPGNTLFFVMTHEPIYLGRLARVMQSLGAAEAMNLDAGTSTGFYYNGATLARPGRKLTNMIVVYGRRDRYERALDQLVPAAYHHADMRPHGQISSAPMRLKSTRTAALVRP